MSTRVAVTTLLCSPFGVYTRLATPQGVCALTTPKSRGTPHGVFQKMRVNPKVELRFGTVGASRLLALQHTRLGMDFSTT
jgi:hypothetical protein